MGLLIWRFQGVFGRDLLFVQGAGHKTRGDSKSRGARFQIGAVGHWPWRREGPSPSVAENLGRRMLIWEGWGRCCSEGASRSIQFRPWAVYIE